MPHINQYEDSKSLISLTILKNPIPWGNETIQIIILGIFGQDMIEKDNAFFDFVYNIVTEKWLMKELIAIPTYDNVCKVFRKSNTL